MRTERIRATSSAGAERFFLRSARSLPSEAMTERPDAQAADLDADLDPHLMGDVLPDDLQPSAVEGPYIFPNNNRRRIPGYLYLVTAAACLALWIFRADDAVLVNDGFLFVAVLLGVIGAYHLVAGWNLDVDESDALVAASAAVGFPVGHASAQLGWRGLRSRPTWRILIYSAESPPLQRGFVMVDGVDGEVLEHFAEPNPEDWSDYQD